MRLYKLLKTNLKIRLTAWYVLFLATTLLVFCTYLYSQLEKSLLNQLDTTLEVTNSGILSSLVIVDNQPTFGKNSESKAIARRLNKAGLAVRLVTQEGQIRDGIGPYQTIPPFLPRKNGYVNLEEKEHTWRIYSQHFTLENQRIWIQAISSLEPIAETTEHLFKIMILGTPLILLGASLGGFFLANRALGPITQIIRTVESIGHDEITKRINYRGSLDEVGRLTLTLNRMLDRLESGIEHERRFSSDASHELRTPLTVIKGHIGVTLSHPRSLDEYVGTLSELDKQVDLLIRLANGLLFLTRLEQKSLDLEAVELSPLLQELIAHLQTIAAEKGIVLKDKIAPNLLILGHSDYLTSLFLNLLDNALKYTPKQGQVFLEAYAVPGLVKIDITNTGPGIPREALPHIFERFYRVETDRSRHTGGSGLGLAIAQEIVRLHKAEMTVTSTVGECTRFSLSFTGF